MPYCPECHGSRDEDALSCPADGCYYRVCRCSECDAEAAPWEAWCIACGASLEGVPREGVVLPLRQASWGSRALAVMVDVVCLSYVVSGLPEGLQDLAGCIAGTAGGGRILLSALVPVLYFTLSSWRGHRSIGQRVLGIAVLSRSRTPLSLGRSLARSILLCLVLAGVGVGALAWVGHLRPDGVAALSGTVWGGWIRMALAPGTLPLQGLLVAASLGLALSLLLPGRRSLHDRAADSDVFQVEGRDSLLPGSKDRE